MFLYSKLLRLFRIDYMFTSLRSLRLRVTWRTESSNNYILKSNVGVSCLLLSSHVVSGWGSCSSRAGLHHLPFPSFRARVWLVLAAPCFNNSIINYTRYSPSAVPSLGGMWGVADCGRCIVRELYCHSALNLVLLCNHVFFHVEHLPVVVILAVVVPIGIVAFALVVCIHRVPV